VVVKALAIQWTDPAEASFERMLCYIEAENPVAARKLWARVMDTLEKASIYPELAPLIPALGRPYREILTVHPFRVIYRTEEGLLRVIAVMGQEQDFDPERFL
jgi:plasmid stabilization system protein ParE